MSPTETAAASPRPGAPASSVPSAGPRLRVDPRREETPSEIIPPEERKAVMSTLNPLEVKWSLAGLVVATVAGIAIPAYFIAENKVTKAGKNTIAVAPDAKLLGGLILVLCAIGFVSLWKGKRTLVTFAFFLIGFAFTIFLGPTRIRLHPPRWLAHAAGLAHQQIRDHEYQDDCQGGRGARRRGRDRKDTPRSTSKKTASPGVRKPPTASKRYTPKAPPRKKIPKPSE